MKYSGAIFNFCAVFMFLMLHPIDAQDKRIGRDVKITWFGQSAFKIDSPKGKVILIDPWLDNPKAPASVKDIDKVDLILVTHAHADHIGNTVELAKKFNAEVVCNNGLANYFTGQGLKNVVGMDISGTEDFEGIKVSMVEAVHSSGLDNNGQIVYGGIAVGYVIEFENGFVIYHAGDTGLFGDMKLIGEFYKPDLVMLPIGGHYTMGPKEAAKACELLNPKFIIPMHYGTFPVLSGTPEELKKFLPANLKNKMIDIIPGEFVY